MVNQHDDQNDTRCDDAVEALYAYLDGEMTAERRSAVRKHLQDCSPCLEAFDFEAELKILVATRCRDEIPADLREKILSALRRPSPPRPQESGI